MRITGSTADAVIQSLYPDTDVLLMRFEAVKKLANVADGERDRLRKYIQDNVPEGRYKNVILTITEGSEQMYPNADGKYALKHYCIVDGKAPEGGIEVVVVIAPDPERLVNDILHELQKGKDNLLTFIKERTLAVGLTIDNAGLYSEKASKKIEITELPNESTGDGAGPAATD